MPRMKRPFTIDLSSTEEAARALAHILQQCPTEERGHLLHRAGTMLRDNAQGYTGALLGAIGDIYNGKGCAWPQKV